MGDLQNACVFHGLTCGSWYDSASSLSRERFRTVVGKQIDPDFLLRRLSVRPPFGRGRRRFCAVCRDDALQGTAESDFAGGSGFKFSAYRFEPGPTLYAHFNSGRVQSALSVGLTPTGIAHPRQCAAALRVGEQRRRSTPEEISVDPLIQSVRSR